MIIKVRFSGPLARKAGREKVTEFSEGITLAEAVEKIFETCGLGKLRLVDEHSTLGYVKVFLNGKIADGKMVLHDSDEIAFYMPVSGG